MNVFAERFKAYLDSAPSVYHAVDALAKELEKAGYCRLFEQERWELATGGRYYLTFGGSALIAFRIPEAQPAGFLMSASHSDRPSFKVKENPELTGTYTRIATEKYGGMLMSTWMDRPLSVAGRVFVQGEEGPEARLVDLDRPLLLIPSVAIHMDRKANEGRSWNPAVDTLPLLGLGDGKGKFRQLLEEAAGGPVLGHDLYLYLRQPGTVWGLDEAFLSGQGLDDLACVWSCAQGFLDGEPGGSLPVLCVFDSEEVGSQSPQGADSDLLERILERICRERSWELPRMLANSFLISADNAHGVHPNHPEYADPTNAPVLGGGLVIKFNANQRYTTDGLSAAVMRTVCSRGKVPVQTFYNRADLPGGSTLGCISLSHVAVPSVDIGLPQLAMHSAYETMAVADLEGLYQAMKTYYSLTFRRQGDGLCLK